MPKMEDYTHCSTSGKKWGEHNFPSILHFGNIVSICLFIRLPMVIDLIFSTETRIETMDAKSLLQPFNEASLADINKKYSRTNVTYENLSSRFLLWGREDVSRQQYCSLYSARLEAMRPVLEKKAKDVFGNNYFTLSCLFV